MTNLIAGLEPLPEHAIYVPLSEAERSLMWMVARERLRLKKNLNPVGTIDRKTDPLRRHFLGACGEYATATVLGLPLDTTVSEGGDGGTDLIYWGLKLDVKMTKGWLLYPDPSRIRADVLVLCNMGEGDRAVYVVGWVTKSEFQQRSFVHYFGHGKTYCMRRDQVHAMDMLASARVA